MNDIHMYHSVGLLRFLRNLKLFLIAKYMSNIKQFKVLNYDAGDPGSHCGRRYKYQMGKGKKEPCGVGLELKVLEKLVISNKCF